MSNTTTAPLEDNVVATQPTVDVQALLAERDNLKKLADAQGNELGELRPLKAQKEVKEEPKEDKGFFDDLNEERQNQIIAYLKQKVAETEDDTERARLQEELDVNLDVIAEDVDSVLPKRRNSRVMNEIFGKPQNSFVDTSAVDNLRRSFGLIKDEVNKMPTGGGSASINRSNTSASESTSNKPFKGDIMDMD